MSLYNWILLVCVCASIGAELAVIAVPSKIFTMMEMTPQEALRSRFFKVLSALSIVYMITIALLLFAGDRVFALYASVLIMLSGSLWLLRRWIRLLRALMVVESTVCLIVLIDVARTLLRAWR